MLSLKYLNKLFAEYAANNTMINSYDSGYIFEINPEPNIQYPLLFTELPSAKISDSIDYEFEIYAVDRLKEDNSNLTDVHNNTFKILSDFRTYLRKNQDLAQLLFIEDESDVEFFAHKYADNTAGAKMQIKVKVINSEQLCEIPLNDFDFGEYVNWTYNYSASTANNVTYTFSAGTGLSVSNNNNNITYTYTGSTSSGSSTNLIAGENINLVTSGSSTIINSVLKFITGGTGTGSIVTTSPATQSFASGTDAISLGQNNSANTAYSVILGGQSNLINQTNSKRSLIFGGYLNHIYTSTAASKQNLISNSYSSKIKGNSFFSSVCNTANSTINGGIYSSIINGLNNTIIEPNGGYIRNCTILNGINNITSGSSSTILNGSGNIAYGSLIGGGGNNKALAGQTVILNGVSNTIEYGVTSYGTIINGLNNTIYAATPYSLGNTIINGYLNKISGKFSTIINGYSNTINSNYSVAIGKNNLIFSGHNFTSIFGDGLNSIKSNTVHVPNLKINNGVFISYLEVTEDITISSDDISYYFIKANSTLNFIISGGSFHNGYLITIKDSNGNADTNNIIITYAGGIDNSSEYTIAKNYGSATLCYSLPDDKFYIINYFTS